MQSLVTRSEYVYVCMQKGKNTIKNKKNTENGIGHTTMETYNVL